MSARETLQIVLARLDEMKAEDIVTIDLNGKTSIADLMVVASGRSNRHVGAVADNVVSELKKSGLKDIRVEGQPHCDWVLIDAGDVIVHVFRPEVRDFYGIEKMWAPGRRAARPVKLGELDWPSCIGELKHGARHAGYAARGRPDEKGPGNGARARATSSAPNRPAARSACATIEIIEIKESRARMPSKRMLEESIALANVIPDGAVTIMLDERGESLGSADLRRACSRNGATADAGGGLHHRRGRRAGRKPAGQGQANSLRFGTATWPHQMVRIMLLEQLYRAVTILSGHPYHRE